MRKFLCAGLLLWSVTAFAYVRTMSDSGVPLFWSSASPALRFNPTNSSGLADNRATDLLRAAFSSWNAAGANVGFSLNASSANPIVSGYDGMNAVYFTSRGSRKLGWGVIAVTEVLYYVGSGQIVEMDMAFNDDNYTFTDVIGDTGKAGPGGRTKIYLQDVATHEAGHAYGVDHSLVGRSSMIYTAFSGQFVMGEDDSSAINTAYPGQHGGAIGGNVRGLAGGMFGVHVTAVNLDSGKVQAGALANSDGAFRVGDLPDGQYALMMEPFSTDPGTVSSYWQNVNHRFCSNSRFRRSFYGSCGSPFASTLTVASGGSVSVGVLAPQCSQMGNPGGAPSTSAGARLIPASGGAAFGTINVAESHWYKLQNFSGQLKVRALSYSLYSPMDLRVEILQANGAAVPGATSVDNVEDPMAGGFTNYDSVASAANLPQADYLIRVTAGGIRLTSSLYPAGYDLLDASGHYLLSVGANGSYGSMAPNDMSACVSVSNRVQNASFTREPASEKRSAGGGCGALETPGSGGSGGSPLQGALFLFLATLVLIKISSQLARSRRQR